MISPILAEERLYIEHIQDRFTQGNPEAVWQIALAAVVLIGILALTWVLGRVQQRRQQPKNPKPMEFFRRVQRRLRLSPADRFRLWRLARVTGVEHPTALLISPQFYDEAVAAYCATHGAFGSRAPSAPAYAALRARLFAAQEA